MVEAGGKPENLTLDLGEVLTTPPARVEEDTLDHARRTIGSDGRANTLRQRREEAERNPVTTPKTEVVLPDATHRVSKGKPVRFLNDRHRLETYTTQSLPLARDTSTLYGRPVYTALTPANTYRDGETFHHSAGDRLTSSSARLIKKTTSPSPRT